MDSFRGFEDEAALSHRHHEEPAIEQPPEIGVDERRMHVRAYNYWVSLLRGRSFPDIRDVEPRSLEDFGPNSVLLDFSADPEDPEIVYIGGVLRDECGLDRRVRRSSEVPRGSLLSRLTDHYLQIIASRSPIGFEAEFVGHGGQNTLYRGILMPLSSDAQTIDFIYGVINWKQLADDSTLDGLDGLEGEVDRAIAAAPAPGDCPVWADGPNADYVEIAADPEPAAADDSGLGPWSGEAPDPEPPLAVGTSLDERLGAARDGAARAGEAEQRSRAALYRALGLAYDFALAAEADPEGYGRLLDSAGLKVQARAPMTPVAKLVFGAGYDKTRLTEYAACLAWARREGLARGALAAALERFDGGLKGIVQAERRARRPDPAPDRAAEIRDRLRTAPAFAHVEVELPGDGDEFVLLIARREQGGRVAIVAPVADSRLVDRAIRTAA